MAAVNRKLKRIVFNIDGTEYQKQVSSWTLNNNTDDPEIFYVFEPGEEFAESAADSWSLDVSFYADWTADGISDFMMAHDGEDVPFTLDHHPDLPGEHVRWTGILHVKAGGAGGDANATETQDTTFQLVGKPAYSRV
jgi:hypothetical protein